MALCAWGAREGGPRLYITGPINLAGGFPDGPGDQGSIDIVSECPVLADPSVVAGHGAGDPVPTEGGRVVHRLACQYDLTFGNLLFHIGSAGASPSDPSSIHIMLIGPPLPSMPAIVLRMIPR